MISILLLLIIAGLCGAVGNTIAGGSRGGCVVSIALGFVGALLGTWIARWAALPDLFTVSLAGTRFPLVWSVIGSALFVAVVSLLTRARKG